MGKSDISVKEKASETNEIQDREGRYADAFRIGHSAYKFVLEFGQVDSEHESTHFHTQVIIGPDSANDFLEMLSQAIRQYEEQFGQITHKD